MSTLPANIDKQDIKALNPVALEGLLTALNQPLYRARQIEKWLYAPGFAVRSFEEMTDLSRVLREQLAKTFFISFPETVERLVSADGTRKYLVRLMDGALVECVGIPSQHGNRLTVCFSTQVGCAMACLFCATGRTGLTRSLTAGEMIDQLHVVAQDFAAEATGSEGLLNPDTRTYVRISNVVAMGQGEPFANYDATLSALRYMNDPKLFNIGARHSTVSTCGLLAPLRRFASEPEQFTLAVSLHSAIQSTRDRLLPRMSKQPLKDLRKVLLRYCETTGRRPTLEYALIDKVNDSEEELNALLSFCKNALFHVNIIPLNAVDSLELKPSHPVRTRSFETALRKAGIETSVRLSRGADIAGACGQLASKARSHL